MMATIRDWLYPFGFIARWIAYAFLFWLRWIGVASFNPYDEDIHDGWSYLGLSVILILSGLALFALTRA